MIQLTLDRDEETGLWQWWVTQVTFDGGGLVDDSVTLSHDARDTSLDGAVANGVNAMVYHLKRIPHD